MSARSVEAVDANMDEASETDRDAKPDARKVPRTSDDMPLPTEPRTIFLGGLFLLALLAALYVASAIVLPVVLAIVLKLLLQPLVRLSDRLGVPHGLSAALAILLLTLSLAALVSGVAGPAASWASKLPEALPQIQSQLAFLAKPIGTVEWMMDQLQNLTGAGAGPPEGPSVRPSNVMGALFSGTANVAAGLFTTLLVLFYLLVSGETFLRRFVEILPNFAEKRQAVEITLDIERNVSAYLITVTLINFIVGVCTLFVMWACGVANPLLWGLIAFVVELRADPRADGRPGDLPDGERRVTRRDLVGAVAGRAVFRDPHHRGRTGDADAVGAPLHHQSGGGDPGAAVLVLDVGRAGCDPGGADAGDHQDRLRRHSSAAGVRAFFGGVTTDGFRFAIPILRLRSCEPALRALGWVERSETHRHRSLYTPKKLRNHSSTCSGASSFT